MQQPPFLDDLYPDSTLFVCNIPFDLNSTDLMDLLPHRSEVIGCSFPQNRGFGFIAYPTRELCLEAIRALDTLTVHGRQLSCRFAKERSRRRANEEEVEPPGKSDPRKKKSKKHGHERKNVSLERREPPRPPDPPLGPLGPGFGLAGLLDELAVRSALARRYGGPFDYMHERLFDRGGRGLDDYGRRGMDPGYWMDFDRWAEMGGPSRRVAEIDLTNYSTEELRELLAMREGGRERYRH
jgi:RNA recognition motif-containing protein